MGTRTLNADMNLRFMTCHSADPHPLLFVPDRVNSGRPYTAPISAIVDSDPVHTGTTIKQQRCGTTSRRGTSPSVTAVDMVVTKKP